MSKNPNLKCRFCGAEKNLVEAKPNKIFSWSIITCMNCIRKLPDIPMGYESRVFKLKNRIINYYKRLKMKWHNNHKLNDT